MSSSLKDRIVQASSYLANLTALATARRSEEVKRISFLHEEPDNDITTGLVEGIHRVNFRRVNGRLTVAKNRCARRLSAEKLSCVMSSLLFKSERLWSCLQSLLELLSCALSDAGDGSEDGKLKRIIPETPLFLVIVHVFANSQEKKFLILQLSHQAFDKADIRIIVVPLEVIPEEKLSASFLMLQMLVGILQQLSHIEEYYGVFIQRVQLFLKPANSRFGKCQAYVRAVSHISLK